MDNDSSARYYHAKGGKMHQVLGPAEPYFYHLYIYDCFWRL